MALSATATAPPPQGHPFQCLITFSVKEFLLMSSLNFSRCSLRLSSPVDNKDHQRPTPVLAHDAPNNPTVCQGTVHISWSSSPQAPSLSWGVRNLNCSSSPKSFGSPIFPHTSPWLPWLGCPGRGSQPVWPLPAAALNMGFYQILFFFRLPAILQNLDGIWAA